MTRRDGGRTCIRFPIYAPHVYIARILAPFSRPPTNPAIHTSTLACLKSSPPYSRPGARYIAYVTRLIPPNPGPVPRLVLSPSFAPPSVTEIHRHTPAKPTPLPRRVHPPRIQVVEVENRVEHQEVRAHRGTAIHRVVGEQHHVAFFIRRVYHHRSLRNGAAAVQQS